MPDDIPLSPLINLPHPDFDEIEDDLDEWYDDDYPDDEDESDDDSEDTNDELAPETPRYNTDPPPFPMPRSWGWRTAPHRQPELDLLRSWSLPDNTPLAYHPENTSQPYTVFEVGPFTLSAEGYTIRIPVLVVMMELRRPIPHSPIFYAFSKNFSGAELVGPDGTVFETDRTHPHIRGNANAPSTICMGNLVNSVVNMYEHAALDGIRGFLSLGLSTVNTASPYWLPHNVLPSYECSKCNTTFISTTRPTQHELPGFPGTLVFCRTCTTALAAAPSLAVFMGHICGCCNTALNASGGRYRLNADPVPGQPHPVKKLCGRCFDSHPARPCKACRETLTDSDRDLCFAHYPSLGPQASATPFIKTRRIYLYRHDDVVEIIESLPTNRHMSRCGFCQLVINTSDLYLPAGSVCKWCVQFCVCCDKPHPRPHPVTADRHHYYVCTACATQFPDVINRRAGRRENCINNLTRIITPFQCTSCHQTIRDGGAPEFCRGHLFGEHLCNSCVSGKIVCGACFHLFPKPHPSYPDNYTKWFCPSCTGSGTPDSVGRPVLQTYTGIHRVSACHVCGQYHLANQNASRIRGDTTVSVCSSCTGDLYVPNQLQCRSCETSWRKDLLTRVDGRLLCPLCIPENRP